MKKSQYLIFLFCVVLMCVGCWYLLFPKPAMGDELSIRFKDSSMFKVNEKVNPISLIESTNSVNILYPTIDTSTPGDKKLLYIAVGDQGQQREFLKEIRVVDPTPPTLLLKKNKVEIYVNDKFDAKSYVKTAYSNYDGKLPVKISGRYQLSIPGNYKIDYQIEDSSGNKVKKTLTLIVKDKVKEKPEKQPEEKEIPQKNQNQENKKQNNTETETKSQPTQPAVTGGQTWLFANGESFESAAAKCNAAGAASGRRYQCNVLQDEKGIYTGYQLDLQ